MRKSLIFLAVPAIALGGCTLFGGRSVTTEPVARRNAPLIIPSTFTLPPPTQQTTARTG